MTLYEFDRMTPKETLSRRGFLSRSLAVPAVTVALATSVDAGAQNEERYPITRKIKLGVVGCGGRGSWIAGLFKEHGGYEMHAVADYFQEVADKCGDNLGVDGARRFSGLHGYKRLIDSGVEAVALETPPYFFPEHAAAAVEADLHVYMAKPVAVDVPGTLAIEATGKKATEGKKVFMVDYQAPTDPVNIEVARAIREGAMGAIAQVSTLGITGSFADPPRTATIESRLQNLIWVNDIALGCDFLGNFDIHALDLALWVIGQPPIAASGASKIQRPNPNSDAHDVCSVIFEYENGVVHNHYGQGLNNRADAALICKVAGEKANAQLNYWGEAFVRGGEKESAGSVDDLYAAGAKRNVATFYENVVSGTYENETIERSVNGVLASVLGREAAHRRTRLTLEEVLKENKKLEVDLSGLKL